MSMWTDLVLFFHLLRPCVLPLCPLELCPGSLTGGLLALCSCWRAYLRPTVPHHFHLHLPALVIFRVIVRFWLPWIDRPGTKLWIVGRRMARFKPMLKPIAHAPAVLVIVVVVDH